MTKSMYVGVSGVARKVKEFYVGVSGVARKVKKAYVGVNGVAREFYSGDFWIPSGISSSSVIAAYQFKGATSESMALTNLAKPSVYKLTKQNSPTWTSANGFSMATANSYLSNTNLNALKTIKTIIVRFAGLPTTSTTLYAVSQIKGRTTGGTDNPLLYARFNMRVDYNGSTSWINSNYPVAITNWSNEVLTYYVGSAKLGTTGVLGYSTAKIYANGTAQTTTKKTAKVDAVLTTETNLSTSYSYSLNRVGGGYLYAAAFYSVDLTAAQHKEVATAMLAI